MVTDPPKNSFWSIVQSFKLHKKDIITYFEFDVTNIYGNNLNKTAYTNFQGYHNIDEFLFQVRYFNRPGGLIHGKFEREEMTMKIIHVYSLV